MALDDELKGMSRFLFGWLGFPLGLIAVIGAFSLGMAIFRDEIALDNKRLILGAFLISFSAFSYHLPTIYATVSWDGDGKAQRHFSPSSLIWMLVFAVATWLTGQRLLHLMTAVAVQ